MPVVAPARRIIRREVPTDGLVEVPAFQQPVLTALAFVGLGPVELALEGVFVDDKNHPQVVRANIVLTYRRGTRICCSEPGCYVPFLGSRHGEVRDALAAALSRAVAPRFSVFLCARFEPGFSFAEPGYTAEDWSVLFEEDHFTVTPP